MSRVFVIVLTDESAEVLMKGDAINALHSLGRTFSSPGPVMASAIRFGSLSDDGVFTESDFLGLEPRSRSIRQGRQE